MSNSSAKQAARQRMKYSGESYSAALSGIPNDNSHGFDSCTPEQLELRALLALGFLNTELHPGSPAHWGLHTLSAYTITVSPRWNRLVLVADAPRNVVAYLIPRRGSRRMRLPGLRLVEIRGTDTYVMLHLPTGAEMAVTGQPSGRTTGRVRAAGRDYLTVDDEPTESEIRLLEELPAMSSGIRLLLAGVTARLSTVDAKRQWAVANWYWDPLDRPGGERNEQEELDGPRRYLWGSGNRWKLTWTGHPRQSDLVDALTDDRVGVEGATGREAHRSQLILCGDAEFTIRHWDD